MPAILISTVQVSERATTRVNDLIGAVAEKDVVRDWESAQASGKISDHATFRRMAIWWINLSDALCWQFSSRNNVDGVVPSFFANLA
jgi:hypothetical protein